MRAILLITLGLSSLVLADFTRSSAGVVTDSITGLQWQDDTIGTATTWQGAIDRCEALDLVGHTDWRLPNINELTSLMDDSRVSPSISTVFQNTASSHYWSSTSIAHYTSGAWSVNFYSDPYDSHKLNNYYMRCVRAGQ